MQHYVRDNPNRNPLGNTVKQRHCDNAQIHGDSRYVIVAVKFDVDDVREHQEAD